MGPRDLFQEIINQKTQAPPEPTHREKLIESDQLFRKSDWGMDKGEDGEANCPACGDPYGLHLVCTIVNAGGQITKIDHHGTKMTAGEPTVRGTTVEIFYGCEQCGCVTAVGQRFHKGCVLISKRFIHQPSSTEEWSDWGGYVDIWRD